MLSIRPQWCELIANGKKTIEVRKSRPKLETPFKCYIYETHDKRYDGTGLCIHKESFNFIHGCGKVIGEFVCDEIYKVAITGVWKQTVVSGQWEQQAREVLDNTRLSPTELTEYLGSQIGYGWHISTLQIYDKPKELGEFFNYCKDGADCAKCDFFDKSFNPYDDGSRCRVDEKKLITRPPQSWCYVEELI